MIAAGLLLALQAAAPAANAAPVTTAASPRALSGRFTCGAHVYDLGVASQQGEDGTRRATLDRLTIDGKPVDAGSLSEAGRVVARLADVVSLDVRCLDDMGEVSLYGTAAGSDGQARRARVRGLLARGRATNFAASVEQPRR